MAENEDGQEKTESPSGKKLSDAREKGQVPRSKELATLLMTLVAAMWFFWVGAMMMDDFVNLAKGTLTLERDHVFDAKKAADLVIGAFIDALWLMTPFLAVMTLVAVLSNILVGGWLFSTEALAPKFSKLNPLTGIKRMVSLNALLELFKALLKFLLMLFISVLFIYSVLTQLYVLGLMETIKGLSVAGDLLATSFLVMAVGLIIIAMIDAPYQLWKHNEDMKMTLQEVKDEYKQTEGSPEIKGRIRRMQREMSMRRMMQDVPNADVIITNPEHYAVALKYDMETDPVPVVLATGVDFNAAQIRTIAQQHEIPIIRSPALARALYYNTNVGDVIPSALFAAVAQVLSMVFQLRNKERQDMPDFSDLSVPSDLKQSK